MSGFDENKDEDLYHGNIHMPSGVTESTIGGSLDERIKLDVSTNGVIGRAVSIFCSIDGKAPQMCLQGVLGWGSV